MKIIIKEFPVKTTEEMINSVVLEYAKKGKEVKTELRGNKIVLYYIDNI